jgi:3'-phosphoadenosine 5'-phosphosulfate sulfotransferase (PAPS reductase)/FAD synthetase
MSDINIEHNYLSLGGGVNSTALMLKLVEKGVDFECVFADHGGDYPETYEYVDMLVSKGYPITVLKTKREGYALYDYCIKYGIIPSAKWRWCTEHWKTRPLNKYFKKPCFSMIGIDAGEKRRAWQGEDVKGVVRDYPLIEWGIDREDCKDIIKRHRLKIPRRSGCFFCPFMTKAEVRDLRERQDLWCRVVALEEAAIERRKKKGKKPYYLFKKPIHSIVHEDQLDFFVERRPCVCGS